MKFRETSLIDYLKKPAMSANPIYQSPKWNYARFKQVGSKKTRGYRFV
jgi:hypothetical protein